ncbi:PREDICTED: fibroblast growth factor 3-like [Branchiostoma belcheri]|uniref:Fibroblast growth factor n=1 Tax=Branchiostoma belcheri TaxID=7741 RepID=A0A6P5AHS3_BRABE|nr:PREDICTED: fibroblast growth factor 3-like [Branchiostoma belcheri]
MEITTSAFLLCTLVVHFLTEFCRGLPVQPAEPMPRSRTPRQVDFTSTYTHLGSNNRTKQLYCRTGYHLQLFSNGAIGGTSQDGNAYAVVHILTVEVGVAGIWGVEASRYLCMDNRGNLYGSPNFTTDCEFLERIQDNGYNTYQARTRRGRDNRRWYVGLDRQGQPRRGSRVRRTHISSQFLPRQIE